MSDSLRPLGLQHFRLPCPLPYPRVCTNSCPLSGWCHPTILSSLITFSSCLQSFPASGSFPVSWLFASGGQSIGALASASALPMNIQGWFPLGLTSLTSLQFKGLSAPQLEGVNSSVLILFYLLSSSHIFTWQLENIVFTIQTFVGKVVSLLFNMLSRLVIAFLPRSKCLLISCLQSLSTVILEPPK